MLRHSCRRRLDRSMGKMGSGVICRSVTEGANVVCWAGMGKGCKITYKRPFHILAYTELLPYNKRALVLSKRAIFCPAKTACFQRICDNEGTMMSIRRRGTTVRAIRL